MNKINVTNRTHLIFFADVIHITYKNCVDNGVTKNSY